jgi:hypothetical protein
MNKNLQIKEGRITFRFQAMVNAGFRTYKALSLAVEKDLGAGVSYKSFHKVMLGEFVKGPKAEAMMASVSKLVDEPVATLWPEIQDLAA